MRKLKGLEHIICELSSPIGICQAFLIAFVAVTIVSPQLGAHGWPFASVDQFPGAEVDPLYNSRHIKDLYFRADPDYSARQFSSDLLYSLNDDTRSDPVFPCCGTRKLTPSSITRARRSFACSILPSMACFLPRRRSWTSTLQTFGLRSTRLTNGCIHTLTVCYSQALDDVSDDSIVQMAFIELEWLPPKRPTRKPSTNSSMPWIKLKRFSLERIILLAVSLPKRTSGSMSLLCVI